MPEGQIAIGPHGERAVFQGGQWVVMPVQPPAMPTRLPGAPVARGTFLPPVADPNRAATAERTRQEITTTAQLSPLQIEEQRLKNEKARRDLAAQQATATPQQQQRMAALSDDEVLTAIADARGNLDRVGATGIGARLPGFIQTQGATDLSGSLRTIASRLTLDKLASLKQLSPTGASGLGSLTEREGDLLRDSVASLGQEQSHDQLAKNLAAVELHYRRLRALGAGQDYRNPLVADRYGIERLPTGADHATLAQGASREVPDPALQGVNSHIQGMIGAGRSAADITAYMNSVKPGLGDQRAGDVAAAVRFRTQNPGVPLDRYKVSVENRVVPISPTRQFFNDHAQTPFGAAAMSAADAATFGVLDNLTENPALTRAAAGAVEAQHPYATVAGGLVGGTLTGAGMERAVGGLGAAWAPRVADALYGAAYGAGSADDGNRLTGAITGSLAGVAGGAVGRLGARVIGNGLRGITNPDVQYLRNLGVSMTPGQMVTDAGSVGRWLRGKEDRLTGFNGVGDEIRARLRTGMEDYNRAGWNEGLAPINAPPMQAVGEEAVGQGRAAVGQAYDRALDGVALNRDPQFGADMHGPVAAANRLPGNMGENARYMLNERVGRSFDPQGVIDGNGFQQSIRGLEQDARAQRSEAFGQDFGGVARGARGAMENLIERQMPGRLAPYLDANAAYRNLSVLGDATASAMNTDGIWTAAQLGNAARQNARTYTGRLSAATPDRPFFDFQRAGQNVLPNKVPDSGTAGRADAGDVGLTASIKRAARNLAYAPLYAESTQPGLSAVLLDRPDWARQAGDQVSAQQGLLGLIGKALVLQNGPLSARAAY